MKRLLIAAAIMLLWASPAMAITLDELPTFNYEIGQVEIEPITINKKNNSNFFLLLVRLMDFKQTYKIATEKTPSRIVVSQEDGVTEFYIVPCQYKYEENNPLLGKQPSEERVYWYFGSLLTLDWYFNKKSQKSLKWHTFNKWWQRINIGFETACVNRNYKIGLGFGF